VAKNFVTAKAISRDDLDRRLFLKTLAEACEETDWQVHAWCLMKNHFHVVLETLQSQFSQRYEVVSGHLYWTI
jgi:REP element-mobilizing transposase RayT